MATTISERRSPYWLWGVLGWLAITILCIATHLGSLEDTLIDRSQAALTVAGLTDQIDGQDITFTGEIATLRGTVSDSTTRARVEDVVAGVSGVRRIRNEIEVVAPVVEAPETPEAAPPPPPPVALRPATVSGVVAGSTITLTGEVPDQDDAASWVAAAESVFGAGNVVDRITVTGEVDTAGWLAGPGFMDDFAVVSDGAFSIDGGRVALTGVVQDQETRDAIGASVAAALPGLSVDNQLEIAPSAAEDLAALDLSGITFETASAVITPDSFSVLDQAVEVLKAFPEVNVEIAGHTDSDGSVATNLALSQARADSVARYLVEQGIEADRLTPVGYGEAEPIADNSTPEGRAENRRIEFVIEGE